jgi:hypothetical protein
MKSSRAHGSIALVAALLIMSFTEPVSAIKHKSYLHSHVHSHSHSNVNSNGIFDNMLMKMNEKETAMKREMEASNMKHL